MRRLRGRHHEPAEHLRTGRALTLEDVFTPASFSKAGMMRLWDGIRDGDDKQQLQGGYTGSGGFFNPLSRESFSKTSRRPESPAWALPFFGQGQFNLVYAGQDFGPASADFGLHRTSAYSFPIPYGKVRDLFKPELRASPRLLTRHLYA